MSENSVLSFEIYRTSLKVSLHDTKTFFDFPSALIRSNNTFYAIIQVSTHSIESIILFFCINHWSIDIADGLAGKLTIVCGVVCFYEALGIIYLLFVNSFTGCNNLYRAFYLPLANVALIIAVFDWIGDNQLLLYDFFPISFIRAYDTFLFNPSRFIKIFISITFTVQLWQFIFLSGFITIEEPFVIG